MTGIFPETRLLPAPVGPLELVWCPESGLVQLGHSFSVDMMFGGDYGYRSGLNATMVRHLSNKVARLEKKVSLRSADIVLDIGSNDATTLKAYKTPGIRRIGIDPTGRKFRTFYNDSIELVPDFFSSEAFRQIAFHAKAKLVTSISMFYDLEDPIEFARQVASVLADDGIWHLEQSYLPAMLQANSYDTICHEHLEYYTVNTLRKILEAAGLKITDVEFNDINGGSFAVNAMHAKQSRNSIASSVESALVDESTLRLDTVQPYREFEAQVIQHGRDLRNLISELTSDGKTVLGYGASTKGNVILQYCGLTPQQIPAIAEVNEEKFGRVTPGTHIPIISEAEAHAMEPDYFLVLPWHFRKNILLREKNFRLRGGKFIFPLPAIEII